MDTVEVFVNKKPIIPPRGKVRRGIKDCGHRTEVRNS